MYDPRNWQWPPSEPTRPRPPAVTELQDHSRHIRAHTMAVAKREHDDQVAARCTGVAVALAVAGLIIWPLGFPATVIASRALTRRSSAMAAAAATFGVLESCVTLAVIAGIVLNHTAG